MSLFTFFMAENHFNITVNSAYISFDMTFIFCRSFYVPASKDCGILFCRCPSVFMSVHPSVCPKLNVKSYFESSNIIRLSLAEAKDFDGAVLRYSFNPFPNKPWFIFTCLQITSFENTVGKGEIALNEQFLDFPQHFLPVWRIVYHFHHI